ncbi:MAG: DUF2075 domain-containing protein [Deltaproteobacteria bacterium]|nr:DUF2075 domain-containing protein [Deltaproteobacteria bacterium]
MVESEARYGWESDFPLFRRTETRIIRGRLEAFIRDASIEQVRAWQASIPQLQHEIGEVLDRDAAAAGYTAILEYELPMETRRPDVVLLVRGPVIVLELKGKDAPSQADVDQAAAYARDLQCYHRACDGRRVVPILVPMRAKGRLGTRSGVEIMGPDAVDGAVEELTTSASEPAVAAHDFLAEAAYRPLPTLVEAARELMQRGDLRRIHRAAATTDPAVAELSRIIHEAAAKKERRLVLLTGLPGAGKTLVGLRTVHAHFLDDLAVPRDGTKPTAPAVFLSGNGPLVEVLQYELRAAGGGGKTFVRDVKNYVKRYSSRRNHVPPEHVLVFDEAQRAYDAEQVQAKHARTHGFEAGKSEPEHFIEFADRIPDWCVVLGLIGQGQEIHVGEEGGIVQWRVAIEGSENRDAWQIHGPPALATAFAGGSTGFVVCADLNLDTEIRFHLASDIHRFVCGLLESAQECENATIAARLERDGYHLRIARDLDCCREYLRERYAEDPGARFGLVASSRDRDLEGFGVPNGYQDTKRVRHGPWYGDAENAEGRFSCRHLRTCLTEFGAQGLELDAVLLAWGTDLARTRGSWSIARARAYARRNRVRDAFQLRLNAYRVLMTRGRDATVVFVPPLSALDETFRYLVESGYREL